MINLKLEMSKKNIEITKDDYYINENGYFVFKESFHLRRGFCCKSNCLHCPYDFKKEKKDDKDTRRLA